MINWLSQFKRLLAGPEQVADDRQSAMATCVDYLVLQMSAPDRAPSILNRVVRFRALPVPQQEEQLPTLYLLLEKYLVEIDPQRPFGREQLRTSIRSRFPELLSRPRFALIFQPPRDQERLLCRAFLDAALQRARLVLGTGSQHLTTDLERHLDVDGKEWLGLLRRDLIALYNHLETTLGRTAAIALFERSYQELLSVYAGLETFPIVVRLLPDQVLDERKIDLLSRSQMQLVLIDKVDELQLTNEQLSRNNRDLETTRTQLQNAKQELEERVVARTRELREANRRIRTSLHEKEALLKEIHHRVKNNLQVVSSLLSLQARNLPEGEMLEIFNESRNRIRSMALIHERLYRSADLASIDFGEYVRSLVTSLTSTYQTKVSRVSVRFEVASEQLHIDRAIPCGLLINELVSNAFKYAFPEGRRGELVVRLQRRQGDLVLEVCDDGIGLPPGLDIHKAETLGLQLVHTLVSQIDGHLRVDGRAGMAVSISFPAGDPPEIPSLSATEENAQ